MTETVKQSSKMIAFKNVQIKIATQMSPPFILPENGIHSNELTNFRF